MPAKASVAVGAPVAASIEGSRYLFPGLLARLEAVSTQGWIVSVETDYFGATLGVKSRLFVHPLDEQFRLLAAPLLQRLNGRLMLQSSLRDEVVVG